MDKKRKRQLFTSENMNNHTCKRPITPQESIREATFTVLLQISYCGFWAPITPAMTGP